MKRFTILMCALAMLVAASATSCLAQRRIVASDKIVTKKVSFNDIKTLSAATSVKVYYIQQSGKAYATIHVPENLQQYLKLEEDKGHLMVRYKFPKDSNISIDDHDNTKVYVYAPDVNDFRVSSAADIIVSNGVTTSGDLRIGTSSSGDFKSEKVVRCSGLIVNGSSAGDISLTAVTCQKARIDISSSSDCNITTLNCTDAVLGASSAADYSIQTLTCASLNAGVSSSADCKVQSLKCKGNIKVGASSGGKIVLAGTCKDADYSASSSGDIHANKLKADNINAQASSGGEVRCYTNGKLTTSYSSGGNIRYTGNPSEIVDRNRRSEGVSRLEE